MSPQSVKEIDHPRAGQGCSADEQEERLFGSQATQGTDLLTPILQRFSPVTASLLVSMDPEDRSAILGTSKTALSLFLTQYPSHFPSVQQVKLDRDTLDASQPLTMTRRFDHVVIPEETMDNDRYRQKAIDWIERNRGSGTCHFTIAKPHGMELDDYTTFVQCLTGEGEESPTYICAQRPIYGGPASVMRQMLRDHDQWMSQTTQGPHCAPILTLQDFLVNSGRLSRFVIDHQQSAAGADAVTSNQAPRRSTLCTLWPGNCPILSLTAEDIEQLQEGIMELAASISRHTDGQLILTGGTDGRGTAHEDLVNFVDRLSQVVSAAIDGMDAVKAGSLFPQGLSGTDTDDDKETVEKVKDRLRRTILFIKPGEQSERIQREMVRDPSMVVTVPEDADWAVLGRRTAAAPSSDP